MLIACIQMSSMLACRLPRKRLSAVHLRGCCAVQAAGRWLQGQRRAVQAEIPLQRLADRRLVSCRAADQLRRAITLHAELR